MVGSDSGRIVVLEFDAKSNSFRKVHQETFGKSGCRRIVPGEYLAVDPQGRACMIAAVEKQKFVYILNRDMDQKVTISSPLEAHKNHTLLFSLAALDVGFDNPLFASIELNYEQRDAQKLFTIHEMDLGINHVVRKYAEPLPDSAHLIVPVTGGADGPGGCLVCCDNFLIYKKLGRDSLVCAYPRRVDCALEKPVMIVAHGRHKLKDFSLILIQSEQGDLFRVDLRRSTNGLVEELRISYFDSIPRSVALCILKTGFMFSASEFGSHAFYQFKAGPLLMASLEPGITPFCSSLEGESGVSIFKPRALSALELFDSPTSLSPLIDMKAVTAPGGSADLFALTGRGQGATLRCLKLGVGVAEMAASDLPGKPSGVWTIAGDDGLDRYIVISFVDATLVLAIGETVQEISTSGLLSDVQTIAVAKLHDGSLIQAHGRGIRHVHEATGRVSEWRAPGGRQVVAAALNSHQAVLGLTGGEIVYFELSQETGSVQEISKRDIGCQIASVAIASVAEGRSRAVFMAVSGSDKSVRILSLEPDKLLKQLSAQSYAVAAESTVITQDGFLSIGLANGTLVRCCLDRITGVLSDPRSRFLGIRPVRLQKVLRGNKRECALALSSKCWLVDPATVGIAPLAYADAVVEFAASFNSELCPDGLVVVSGDSLRIVTLNTQSTFSELSLPLSHTPRKLCVVPSILPKDRSVMLAVLEADMHALTDEKRQHLVKELQTAHGVDEQDDWSVVGTGGQGSESASCVRIVNPATMDTHVKINMDDNETATAVAITHFFQLKDKRPCLLIAAAEDQKIQPKRSAKKSVIKTFLYDENFSPQLVHVTLVSEGEGVPLAMCAFEGRVLVSLSAASNTAVLRLYELGKKKLLKKSEYRNTSCGGFVSVQVIGDRIFAADTHNSIHVIKLNKVDGQMYVVCDDTLPRYVSSMLLLDYNTVMGADKFDNLFVNRIPVEVREDQAGTGEAMVGSGGLRLGPDTTYILGKNHKFEPVNQFHVGETITSLQKVTLAPGASEVVLYSTLSGAIGVLYPFASKKEYDTFLALETHLSNALGTSLVGRDHAAFRGYYLPSKGVVDGDLVAAFSKLPNKADVAQRVGKSVNEIEKMIEEIRNRIT